MWQGEEGERLGEGGEDEEGTEITLILLVLHLKLTQGLSFHSTGNRTTIVECY